MRAATPGATAFPRRRGDLPEIRDLLDLEQRVMASARLRGARRVARHVVLRDRERELGGVVDDVLEDRVDVHVLRRDGVEDRRGRSRPVGHVAQREHDLVFRMVTAETIGCSSPSVPSTQVPDSLENVDRAWIGTSWLRRSRPPGASAPFRAGRRHLEHLLVRDAVELARLRDDPRIRGEHALDVRVDLARRAERRRERHGGASVPPRPSVVTSIVSREKPW